MEIIPLGHASFKLRGRQATVVTDPYESAMVGLKFPKHVEANIVTISHEHQDHNAASIVSGNPFVVRGPGEYEVKGVSIIGTPTFHDEEKGAKRGRNTVYRIEIDGMVVVHLGDLGHVLASHQVDVLDGVDILLVPVGGFYTINAAQAAEVVSELEPVIVVPMHYGRLQLNQQAFGSLLPVAAFLKEMGKEDITPQPKLSISRDKLPPELQVVILE